MKKLIIISIALLIPVTGYAQTTFRMRQLVLPNPNYVGVVVGSTTAKGYLEASSSPTALSFTATSTTKRSLFPLIQFNYSSSTLYSSFNIASTTFLNIGGDSLNDLEGDGLVVTSNALLFDCSDVASTGLQCSGEDLQLDATGDWTGTFDGVNGADYTLESRALTIAGTANQITSSAGAQDLTADRTWTLSIPSQFNIQQASTTVFSALWAKIGGTASTTIDNAGNVTYAGLLSGPYSSSTIYSSFITASTTNLNIGGSSFISLLGNGLDNTGGVLTANCVEITGSAGLCDGSDDGAGATIGKAWEIGPLNYLAPTTTVSVIVGATSSPRHALFQVTATGTTGDLINASSTASFAGNFLRFLSSTGAELFKVASDGATTIAGALNLSSTLTFDSETLDSLTDDATLANNSGDLQVVDVTCTDCLNATEIEDIYLLNTSDSFSGTLTGPYSSSTIYSSFVTASTTNLIVNGQSFNNLLGTGLQNTGGALTLNATGDWTGTIDGNNFAGGAVEAGDLLYGASSGSLGEIDIGTGGFILAVSNGTPAWVATTSIPVAGDVTGTLSAIAVTDDSHAHTGTTLSGIDISDDTNLTAGDHITLTGDDLDVDDDYLLNTGDTGTGDYTLDSPTFALVSDRNNIGIGTTTPRWALQVASTTGPQLTLTGNITDPHWSMRSIGGILYFATSSPTTYATSTNAISISSVASGGTGGLNIGTGTPTSIGGTAIDSNGTVYLHGLTQATSGTNNDLCISGTPNQLIEETTGVCVVSMRNSKHDILDLSVGIETLLKLKPVSYSPNEDEESDYNNTLYGFVAEDLADTDPHLARYGIDGKPRTIDDWGILSLVVNSVQDVWGEIVNLIDWNKDQEVRIKALEDNNKLLEERIRELELRIK